MKTTFLTGKNIYLRPLEEKDIEGNYVAWLNDPEVCSYNSHHVFPYTHEGAKNYIKTVSKSPSAIVLAIVLKKNNMHIGNISLQNINYINRSAELAILIGEKKYWGRGYSKEAAYLIVNHGFQEINLHRIYCGTSAKNTAMQKLADFLGMKEEGRRREAMFKHNRFVDAIEYGLLSREFFRRFPQKRIKDTAK